ncbi:MAG: hypothetical protein P1P77_13585 [Spirochaetaceae bacterium]|nr:hypothetical protein [Spirochaetaceae bacterium]
MLKPDANINLPCKIFLSQEGNTYCVGRGIPLENLVSLDGAKGFGFNRSSVMAPLVQQLTANNLITRIESEDIEFISKRKAVIDTTKLIVYGILYRRFRPTLNAILLDSEVVRYLQSKGTVPLEGNRLRFDPKTVAKFVEENGKAIRSMKASLLFNPHKAIDENSKLDDEQKERKKQITRKFIDTIENDTWFLFNYVRRSSDKVEIVQRLDKTVSSFMNKTNIADAIAFMLMELVQNAETEHFKYIASKDNMARVKGDGIYELLRDEEFRQRMKERAKTNKSLLHLVYHFDNLQDTSNSKKTRIRVSITNKGRMDVSGGASGKGHGRRRKEMSLADHLQSDLESLGNPMGMVYYSYLEEACREEKVSLESNFSIDESRNETTALMTVTI